MARSSRRSRNSSIVTINMKGVEGKRPLIAPGEYPVRVVEVSKENAGKGKDDYLAWVFEIFDDDKYEGAKLYNNTSLSKNSLWNLKGMLDSLDVEVPDDEMDLDLEDMVDREMIAVVDHEDYEGKPRARIVDFEPVEKKGKGKSRDDDRGSRRSSRDDDGDKGGRRRGRDDDEGDKGSRLGSSRRSRSEPEPLTQDEVNDMDQEQLEEVNKEYGLKLDLDELKTLRKMKSAVIDALEEEKLLKDD